MPQKTKYKLAAIQSQKRLAELSKADASDLRDEVGLTRFLLEDSIGRNPSAAIPLLTVLARLSQADITNRLRTHELLERTTVKKLLDHVCDIISDELKEIDGYEEIIERIANRITAGMEKDKNEE